MEFLDGMPPEEKQQTKPEQKKVVSTAPSEGFALELGSLTFYMGEVELEVKDIKVRDMEEFRDFLMEVMDK